MAGIFDIELVRIQGTLLHLNKKSREYTLVLSSGSSVFDAVLPSRQGCTTLSAVSVGAGIQVTGICLVEADAIHKSQNFRILFRSPRDVTVVETPSWWTARRSLYALTIRCPRRELKSIKSWPDFNSIQALFLHLPPSDPICEFGINISALMNFFGFRLIKWHLQRWSRAAYRACHD